MKKKTLIYTVCALVTVILYLLSPFIPAFFYSEQYATTNTDHMIIIGHRGGAALAPENTLACYRKGIEAGADMIEIDIHLTRDGHVVVCHDQSVDRTTNGKGLIRELTLNEIRQLHIVDRNGNQTNERIPTLEEVFQLFQEVRSNGNPCQLLIEIKRTRNIYQGLEEKLLEQIYQNKASNWVTVQSFNDFALEHIHKLDSSIRLEKLLFCKLPLLPLIIDGYHISRFSYEKYSYVRSFNFQYHGIWHSLLDDLHSHGKEVKLWTLEDLDAPALSVDGIITNRPDIWVEHRNNKARSE